MHLDVERTERLLHGELSPDEEAAARSHVATCPECGERLRRAGEEEREVFELLGRLDGAHPAAVGAAAAPGPDAGEAATGADAGVEPRPAPRRSPARVGWWRVAAALVALGAAGTAWALPGSPLPGWWSALVDGDAAPEGPADPDGVVPAEAGPAARGISVAPGPELVVDFVDVPPGAVADVVVGAGDEVAVRTDDEGAAFSSREGRLVVTAGGSEARWEIRVPATAARVDVRAGGRLLLRVEAGRATGPEPIPEPETDGTGPSYRIPLSSPDPTPPTGDLP